MPARVIDTPEPEVDSMALSLKAQQNIEAIKKRRHGERQRIQGVFDDGVRGLRARVHEQTKARAEKMKKAQKAKVLRLIAALEYRDAKEKAIAETATHLHGECGKLLELLDTVLEARARLAQEASFAPPVPSADEGKGKGKAV